MKILHLFKSEPDTETRQLADALGEGRDADEISLAAGPVDYDRLVEQVFDNDQVVCWW
ncbi:hypothetical protein ACFL2P_00155 [Candidatus Moduliflexota bacterium]